jgi:hypothetical protein
MSPCGVQKIKVLSEFKINTDLFVRRSFHFKASNDYSSDLQLHRHG